MEKERDSFSDYDELEKSHDKLNFVENLFKNLPSEVRAREVFRKYKEHRKEYSEYINKEHRKLYKRYLNRKVRYFRRCLLGYFFGIDAGRYKKSQEELKKEPENKRKDLESSLE
jgi:hypothetical protein